MNLVDLERTGVQDACLHVRELAQRYGTDVAGVELVGLIPGRDLDRCTDDFLQWSRLDVESTIEVRVGKGPLVARRPAPGTGLRDAPRRGSGAGEAAPGERALAADPAAFPLGHPAPDPELLAVAQGVLEALGAHLAAPADGLRLLGGGAPLREEQVGVDSEAVRSFLPTPVSGVDVELDQHLSHRLPPSLARDRTSPGWASRGWLGCECRRWNYNGVILSTQVTVRKGEFSGTERRPAARLASDYGAGRAS